MKVIDKLVKLDLTNVDGNAFSVLGAFGKAARADNWTKEEIYSVIHEATRGDYDHLLATIIEHTA